MNQGRLSLGIYLRKGKQHGRFGVSNRYSMPAWSLWSIAIVVMIAGFASDSNFALGFSWLLAIFLVIGIPGIYFFERMRDGDKHDVEVWVLRKRDGILVREQKVFTGDYDGAEAVSNGLQMVLLGPDRKKPEIPDEVNG